MGEVGTEVPISQPESTKGVSRRTFLTGGAVALGAGAATAVGAVAVAERALPKTTIDEEVNVGGNRMHLIAQEFNPREGNIRDSKEVVIFLAGAPMRANASVTWEGPESLAEKFKVRAYEIDARPVGYYSGNAIDLEVAAIMGFIKKHGFERLTIYAHSVGVPKALKLAAEIYEKEKDIQVNGVVAANPVGFYHQDRAGIVGSYFADGLNQSNLQNPRTKHASLPEVATNIAGSIASDVKDAGLGYPKLLADQMESATQVSPDLARVHAPVVFLIASEDKVVKKDFILPLKEIVKYLPPTTVQGAQMRAILTRGKDHKWDQLTDEEQGIFGSKEEFVKVQREQVAQIGYANDAYAKDTYLPNSEQVRVIIANKYASHLAFNERRDMTSHVAARIFEWMRRNPPERRVKKI